MANGASPCATNPCYHGDDICTTGCYPSGYGCACSETDRYGQDCENRDGNWTEWSVWNACFLTCDQHTRFRTCTDPPPLGIGSTCIGAASEIQLCNVQYADCATHFGYQFEQLNAACDVYDLAQVLAIDECIEYCQNHIECVGIVHDNTTCTSFVGKISC